MRERKGKSLIALLAVLVLLVSTVGITVAYFSDRDATAGALTISLTPDTTIHEGTSDEQKDVTIENTGDTDVVVRVQLFGPEGMVVTPGDGWVQSTDGWYYYNEVLAAGGETKTAINAKIEFTGTDEEIARQKAELGDNYQITVIHEASVATYAGDAVDTPDGWTLPEGFSFK